MVGNQSTPVRRKGRCIYQSLYPHPESSSHTGRHPGKTGSSHIDITKNINTSYTQTDCTSKAQTHRFPVPTGKSAFAIVLGLGLGTAIWAAGTTLALARSQNPSISQDTPRFTVPSTRVAPSGSFAIRWSSAQPAAFDQFELQQSRNRDFSEARLIYSGPDRASYVSGLPNGDFYYRVRGVNTQFNRKSRWASPIRRIVQHPSLEFAVSMWGVGALVFLSTLGVVLSGAKNRE